MQKIDTITVFPHAKNTSYRVDMKNITAVRFRHLTSSIELEFNSKLNASEFIDKHKDCFQRDKQVLITYANIVLY